MFASRRALGHTAEAAKRARRKNFALQEYYGRHSFMLTASPCAENSFMIRLYADSGVMASLFVSTQRGGGRCPEVECWYGCVVAGADDKRRRDLL